MKKAADTLSGFKVASPGLDAEAERAPAGRDKRTTAGVQPAVQDCPS
jgi:hypothetical protein